MLAFFVALPFLFAFSSAGAFPKPLSKEEEAYYLNLYHTGNEVEKKEAKDKLILHNLRLVAHIAKKYSSTAREPEELISIGIIGLIKAVDSYNIEKNVRLVSYAAKCVQNELLMWLRSGKKYQNDISLHEPIGTDRDGNEIVMLDIINSDNPDFVEAIDFSIKSEKMFAAIQSILSPRERTVIILRYGLGNHDILTQQEIAERLGISRSYSPVIIGLNNYKKQGCIESTLLLLIK
ncbi:RNA polymerase sporulation sigma factor SigK [Anaerotignum sp. MB30-C6]|uniref:RNA polymerase sporulation sigma factor SigK n=1 Tax=Anaerotignum sp. MB30-C6 TaxID=3070814 RepID=UPI0027DC5231|nr:RNA polymerase sporulation sigma factor SigK [Anaerotignum sp. MB30-C6]WMI82313.1 RNA polymerase sporulation sigma factor SigK [Anaerotignum sp. MB30-C6]